MTTHREIRLQSRRESPTNNGDDGILYVKSLAGEPQLFFKTTDGGIVQITSIGTSSVMSSAPSSTDNAVVRFDGETGNIIQNSGIIIDDSNNMSIPYGAELRLPSNASHRYSGGVSEQPNASGAQNQTFSFGYNITAGGTKVDSSEPAIYDTWEGNWLTAGDRWQERHWQYVGADGTARRPFSLVIDRATHIPTTTIAGKFSVMNEDQTTQRINVLQAATGVATATMFGVPGVANTLRFDFNNAIAASQLNAAGSNWVSLIHLNSADEILLGGNAIGAGVTLYAGATIGIRLTTTELSLRDPSSGTERINISGSDVLTLSGIASASFDAIPAATGNIRFSNTSAIRFRNNANNADRAIVVTDASDNTILGNSTGSTGETFLDSRTTLAIRRAGAVVMAQVNSSGFSILEGANLAWGASVVSPTLFQATDTVNTTGDPLLIQAQSLTTATGAKTAGALTLAAGDCAGGTTNVGGALTLRSGTGATAAGELTIQRGTSPVMLQSSGTTLLVGDTSTWALMQLRGVSGATFQFISGFAAFQISNTALTVSVAAVLDIAAGVVSPIIRHIPDTTATSGDTFLIQSQSLTTASGAKTAGGLTLAAGDCTGGTTNVGGQWWGRSGDGATDCGPVLLTSGTVATSTTRARAIIHYDESIGADAIEIGGTGPSAAYTTPLVTRLWAANTINFNLGGQLRAYFDNASGFFELRMPTIRFHSAQPSPTINQLTDTGVSAAGDTLLIHAQDCTGTTSIGGDLHLRPGGGTSADGYLELQDGAGFTRISVTDVGNVIIDPDTEATVFGSLNVDSYIKAGSSPATTGSLRLPDSGSIYYWSSASSQSRKLIDVVPGTVTIGNTSPNGEANLNLLTQTLLNVVVTGASRMTCSSTLLTLVNVNMSFGTGHVSPIINQASETGSGVSGDTLTIHAQDSTGTGTKTGGHLLIRAGNATGGTDTGGNLTLQGGLGDSPNFGTVLIKSGDGTTRITVNQVNVLINNDAIVFDASVVTPNIYQDNEESGTASDLLTIHAQNNTVDDGVGGDLFIHAGDSTGLDGYGGNLFLRAGDGGGDNASSGNIGFFTVGASAAFEGMQWGFLIKNSRAIPTANPSGGTFMYAESGALKARGSSGTITTMAPADPHCNNCGRDCSIEFNNKDEGWHIAACLWCITDAINNKGIIKKEQL